MKRIELFNDHFQNFKVYGIPHAQLIIADPPYNLGKNAYASNPAWYKDGDNIFIKIIILQGCKKAISLRQQTNELITT